METFFNEQIEPCTNSIVYVKDLLLEWNKKQQSSSIVSNVIEKNSGVDGTKSKTGRKQWKQYFRENNITLGKVNSLLCILNVKFKFLNNRYHNLDEICTDFNIKRRVITLLYKNHVIKQYYHQEEYEFYYIDYSSYIEYIIDFITKMDKIKQCLLKQLEEYKQTIEKTYYVDPMDYRIPIYKKIVQNIEHELIKNDKIAWFHKNIYCEKIFCISIDYCLKNNDKERSKLLTLHNILSRNQLCLIPYNKDVYDRVELLYKMFE
jgi:hypothetical protein